MRGLNRKQREFLVDILGKVIVYILTVTIIGKLIGQTFSSSNFFIIILIVTMLIAYSLFLLKKGDQP